VLQSVRDSPVDGVFQNAGQRAGFHRGI
jgi:hypothetical protein